MGSPPKSQQKRRRQYASHKGQKTGSEKPPEPLRRIPSMHRAEPLSLLEVKNAKSRSKLLATEDSVANLQAEYLAERREFVSKRNEKRRILAKARWGQITLPSFLKIRPRWYTYDKVVELKPSTSTMCDNLFMRDRHIIQLKIVFDQIDVDHSGKIDIWEFLNFLNEPRTLFTENFFKLIDLNGDGDLTFDEFIQAIVGNCVMTKPDILDLCFDMFDKDKSGAIEGKEYVEMALCFRENDSSFGGNLQHVVDNFDDNDDGMIDLEEFTALNEKFPMLLYPAFRMQQNMQKKTLGVKTWLRILKHQQHTKKAAKYAAETNGLPLPETRRDEIMRFLFGPPWSEFQGVKDRIAVSEKNGNRLEGRMIVPSHAASAERSAKTTLKAVLMNCGLVTLRTIANVTLCTSCRSRDHVISPVHDEEHDESVNIATNGVNLRKLKSANRKGISTRELAGTLDHEQVAKLQAIENPVERVITKASLCQYPTVGSQIILNRLEQPSAVHTLTMKSANLVTESDDDSLTCPTCLTKVPRNRMATHQTFCSTSTQQYSASTLAKIQRTERPRTAALDKLHSSTGSSFGVDFRDSQVPRPSTSNGMNICNVPVRSRSSRPSSARPSSARPNSARPRTNASEKRLKRPKSAKNVRPSTANAAAHGSKKQRQQKQKALKRPKSSYDARRPQSSKPRFGGIGQITDVDEHHDFREGDTGEFDSQVDIHILADDDGGVEQELHSYKRKHEIQKKRNTFAPTPTNREGGDIVSFFESSESLGPRQTSSLKPINLQTERNRQRSKAQLLVLSDV